MFTSGGLMVSMLDWLVLSANLSRISAISWVEYLVLMKILRAARCVSGWQIGVALSMEGYDRDRNLDRGP